MQCSSCYQRPFERKAPGQHGSSYDLPQRVENGTASDNWFPWPSRGRQAHALPYLQKTGEAAARRESAGRNERRRERGGGAGEHRGGYVPAVPGLVGGFARRGGT
ncbi:hypothetical protein HPB52_012087 [Rhipicephalus sanguineus]|uniref:Uncharacterized protein n=1 Tax=Rhipicephalus sanguineus TaxID=34632 RepID=A0A9D4YPM8_RHISA|nr:hypothetical protein HPB52_012087 [Rhipicephalus sanguineus]